MTSGGQDRDDREHRTCDSTRFEPNVPHRDELWRMYREMRDERDRFRDRCNQLDATAQGWFMEVEKLKQDTDALRQVISDLRTERAAVRLALFAAHNETTSDAVERILRLCRMNDYTPTHREGEWYA